MNNKSLNKIKGSAGEKIAVEFLEKIGYKILNTNFRSKIGEIDIIAEGGEGNLNFIEVKSRFSNAFGKPSEAINNKKKRKIIECSQLFMQNFKIDINRQSVAYGLISIEFLDNDSLKLIYFENAFD